MPSKRAGKSERLRHPGSKSLHQHHELQILFDISSAVHSSPRLEDVLHQALIAILGTLQLQMGAIYLASDADGPRCLFSLAAHHGFSAALIDSIQSLSISSRQLERLGDDDRVVWFHPDKLLFPDLQERMKEDNISEIVCIPLMAQKKVLGLLYVTNDGDLQVRPERSEFLTTIGQQIGVAIENAQLFESVQRAKTELEISFDAIQHSIFIIDNRRRILRVNRTSEMIYGSAEDLIGQAYAEVLYQQQQPVASCPVLECLQEARPVQRDGPHHRWGGFYSYYAFPVMNRLGQLERVVYYEKDVTEARKLEYRLQQTEKLKALGTLAAGIAHEIRNPLATINFNAQLLHRDLSVNPAQEQMFADMLIEVKKIDRIVQQVLSFARPRQPQFLPNQLNDVVRYCHDLAKVHMRKASIEVVLDLCEDVPSLIMDFNQISQVIMNLVINAIDAMADGGGKLTLRTKLQEEPRRVILQVSDTGPGILPTDESRIFDPFFTRKPEGTGLGLSISRQILEKHGAFVEVNSVPGQGCTFQVTFPISGSEERDQQSTASEGQGSSRRGKRPGKRPGDKK
jgi:two-component system, NtrC family, sensor kinase